MENKLTTIQMRDGEVYVGNIRKLSWLNEHQIGLTTNIPDFPVRVLEMSSIATIDNKEVKKVSAIEIVSVSGSKGAVYNLSVRDGKAFKCDCPGATFHKGMCKHIRQYNSENV
jgi:hypothetical protein